jgi:hypothetical protein
MPRPSKGIPATLMSSTKKKCICTVEVKGTHARYYCEEVKTGHFVGVRTVRSALSASLVSIRKDI